VGPLVSKIVADQEFALILTVEEMGTCHQFPIDAVVHNQFIELLINHFPTYADVLNPVIMGKRLHVLSHGSFTWLI